MTNVEERTLGKSQERQVQGRKQQMTVNSWKTDIIVNFYRTLDSEDNWESSKIKSRNQLLQLSALKLNYHLVLPLLLLGSYNVSGVNPKVSLISGFSFREVAEIMASSFWTGHWLFSVPEALDLQRFHIEIFPIGYALFAAGQGQDAPFMPASLHKISKCPFSY